MMTAKVLRSRLKHWHERAREPGLTALLVIQASLIFLVVPLSGMGLLPAFVLPVMFVLLVVAILVVTSHSRAPTIAVLISIGLVPFGAFVHAEHPSLVTECISAVGRLLAIVALSAVIGRVVFGPGRVTVHRVQGAIILYLNFALIFFTIYRFLDLLLPGSFNGLPPTGAEFGSGAALLYFSFCTLTTLGMGDITPLHPLARNLTILEAMIGQLYLVTVLARLVSLEIEHRRSR